MFRKFRILALLLVLATIAVGAWRADVRLKAWEHSIHVAIYPIAGDDSPATRSYVSSLNADSFEDIAEWMQAESKRYERTVLQPIALNLAPPLVDRPPLAPSQPSVLDAILWSLKVRWWAATHDTISGPKPQVRLFVLFHDPALTSVVPHSSGLAKGQVALIHAYATRQQQRQNSVVIAHELLHTLGATDKYDAASLQPIFPQGYADPQLNPRWPQSRAEIMGGRIPIDEQNAEIPASLAVTVIGPETATEIGLKRVDR